MPAGEYDAVVVGASFAGLAVARQLRGRVLLLDRNEVGAVQTSACGTPLWVPQALGVASSVLQVHERLTVRAGAHSITYDLSAVPFCTFDYRKFCEGLLAQCRARFLRTPVKAIEEGRVVTGDGSFATPVVVDCSGWRGILVNGGGGARPGRGAYTFGLESHTSLRDEGLTFFIDRAIVPGGLGWIFPVGSGSLIGLGSYAGRSKLRPLLDRYLRAQRIAAGPYHGTYFPNRLGRATVGRLFAVGDAAGQCLPLTAEGIRPALYFGSECGQIVQRILAGSLTLEAGLESYRQRVARYRRAYRILGWVQWMTVHAPTRWLAVLTDLAARRPLAPRWWPRYGWFGHFGPGTAPT
ncbi:MAG TPA: NAD(P)/FAD-dependent oxidoreductase [Candidatus Methylomirabilis sp.]|nr:NAD(P)/FAD-dependent oxidoreductase [Candidatus Methylomirabilis sp.]